MSGEGTKVAELDEQGFEAEVLRSPIPVLVDFYSQHCAPCRVMHPRVEALAAEYAGRVKVAKLDVYAGYRVALRYNIQAVPTFLLFRDGEAVDFSRGQVPQAVLEEKIERVLAMNAK